MTLYFFKYSCPFKVKQIRDALQNGDYETAKQLREQLGSLEGFGCPKGEFGGHRMGW